MNKLPLAKSHNILIQEVDDELLIYNLESHKAICLNHTSAIVWQECDGNRDIAEIGSVVSKKLKVPIDENFIRLALNELKKEKLLENSDEMDDPLAGVSRREIVKRVGLASMVALPIVSSIIAPEAVNAQSGQPPSICPPGSAGACTDIFGCINLGLPCPGREACLATCCCCVGLPGQSTICF